MVFESIIKSMADTVLNPYSFWMLALIVGFIVFIILKIINIPKMYAGMSAFIITLIGLEYGLKQLFLKFNTLIDFGSYTIYIPVYGDIIIKDGVMLMRFLDFTFNFGIFRNIGIPYLGTISTEAAQAMVLPVWFKLFVALYVSMDSILGYFFLVALIGSVLVFASRYFNINKETAKLYTYTIAAIPIFVYSYYISNLFYEYGVALPQLQKVYYLTTHGSPTDLLIFFGSLMISIALVMEIIAMSVTYLLGIGQNTMKPDWATKQYTTNVHGIGFTYTIAFAIVYALHNFEWYIFFPALMLYTVFKNVSEGIIDSAHVHEDREDLRNMIRDAVATPESNGTRYVNDGGGGGSSSWIIYMVLAVGVAAFVVWKLGIFT